jgi:hypothetical protein
MIFPSAEQKVRSRLVEMIQETGREVIKSVVVNETWTILVRQDLYHFTIMHRNDDKYMSVVFPARLSDETTIRKIDAALQNPLDLAKFQYNLKQVITTPTSSFHIHTKDALFAGFDTIIKIYPGEKDFSLNMLDTAIQTAVSTGIVGIAFISTVIDARDLEQQVAEYLAHASPDGMYN